MADDMEQVVLPGNTLMDEHTLLAALKTERDDARNLATEIQTDREAALQAYNQEPYGDEVAGQSQVVASDVRDIVEMMLPDLVEPLVGNDAPVVFEPVGQDDVDAAEAESDAVHYVFTQQNEGYLNIYTAVKDVLVSKNAYAAIYWDEYKQDLRESYNDLSLLQLALLQQDPAVRIVAGKVEEGPEGPRFDVVCRRSREQGQVCVRMLAPEKVWVNRFHSSPNLDDARCVMYEEMMTESDLLEQGYDPDQVKGMQGWSGFVNGEELERWKKEGGTPGLQLQMGAGATRVVSVLNFFVRIDYDGDGFAELRWVRTDATMGVVLNNEEVDRIPVVSFAGIINTHKHHAVAVADTLLDIQKIRTVLERQGLNNMYLTNYGRTILGKGAGNNAYGDLMAPRPGGVVRVDDMNSVKTDFPNPMAANSIQWFQQLDVMRTDRVGTNRDTAAIDPKNFSNMPMGLGLEVLNRAQARAKMMLRNIAETGLKHAYVRIHELLMKHGMPMTLQRGGAFETMNPREWKRRERLVVKVGTGSANRAEKVMMLEGVLQKQQQIITMQGGIEGPFVKVDDISRALKDWSRAAGAPMGRFFSDGADWTPPPKQQTPEQLYAVAQAKKIEVEAMEKSTRLTMDWQQQRFMQRLEAYKATSGNYLKSVEIEQHYGDVPELTQAPAQMEAGTPPAPTTGNMNA